MSYTGTLNNSNLGFKYGGQGEQNLFSTLGNCIIKIHIDVDKCLTNCMSSESMHM